MVKIVSKDISIWLESLKEPLRLAVLGAVSLFITILTNQVTTVPQTEATIILLFVLRWIDKFFHEKSKYDAKARITGLVPF